MAFTEVPRGQRRGRLGEKVNERIDEFGLAAPPAVDCLLLVTDGKKGAAVESDVFCESLKHSPLAQ